MGENPASLWSVQPVKVSMINLCYLLWKLPRNTNWMVDCINRPHYKDRNQQSWNYVSEILFNGITKRRRKKDISLVIYAGFQRNNYQT